MVEYISFGEKIWHEQFETDVDEDLRDTLDRLENDKDQLRTKIVELAADTLEGILKQCETYENYERYFDSSSLKDMLHECITTSLYDLIKELENVTPQEEEREWEPDGILL